MHQAIRRPVGPIHPPRPQATRNGQPDTEAARLALLAHLASSAGKPIPVHDAQPGRTGRADEVIRHMDEHKPRSWWLLLASLALLLALTGALVWGIAQ